LKTIKNLKTKIFDQGYNWMFASSDEPHGTVVEWSREPNSDSLEPGSFQPLLKAFYSGSVSITLDANQSINFQI